MKKIYLGNYSSMRDYSVRIKNKISIKLDVNGDYNGKFKFTYNYELFPQFDSGNNNAFGYFFQQKIIFLI